MLSKIEVIRAGFGGKSIGRALFNDSVARHCAHMSGRVLDIAGGASPGYVTLLPREIDLVRTNYLASDGVTRVDFNEPLPFDDRSFDSVLFYNAIYIAERPDTLLREIVRVLKPGGTLYLSSPFIANEMPEPHDYVRFTAEGLERVCRGAGFSNISIHRYGERGSAAMGLLAPFLVFNVLRGLAYPCALALDALVPRRVRESHPCPLFYFVICNV